MILDVRSRDGSQGDGLIAPRAIRRGACQERDQSDLGTGRHMMQVHGEVARDTTVPAKRPHHTWPRVPMREPAVRVPQPIGMVAQDCVFAVLADAGEFERIDDCVGHTADDGTISHRFSPLL